MYSNGQTAVVKDQGNMKALIILLFFVLLFHLIGLAGPGWIVFSVGGLRMMSGIWFSVLCTDNACETVSMVSDDPSVSTNGISTWVEYQALVTVATAIAAFAFITLICMRRSPSLGKYILVAICSPIIAVLSIQASIKVAVRSKMFDLTEVYEFPWALFITGIGGLLALLIMLINICFMCKVRAQRESVSYSNQPGVVVVPGAGAPAGGAQAYPAGYSTGHNTGYSSGYPGAQQQPFHTNASYGMGGGSELYPSLSQTEKYPSAPSIDKI